MVIFYFLTGGRHVLLHVYCTVAWPLKPPGAPMLRQNWYISGLQNWLNELAQHWGDQTSCELWDSPELQLTQIPNPVLIVPKISSNIKRKNLQQKLSMGCEMIQSSSKYCSPNQTLHRAPKQQETAPVAVRNFQDLWLIFHETYSESYTLWRGCSTWLLVSDAGSVQSIT